MSVTGKTSAIDYREIFLDKIVHHNHLPNIELYPDLKTYFEGSAREFPKTSFSLRKSFQDNIIKYCSLKKENTKAWKKLTDNILNNDRFKEMVPDALRENIVSPEKFNEMLRTHPDLEDLPRLKFFLDTGKKDFSDNSEVVRREFSDLLIELCSGKIKPGDFLHQLQNKEFASLDLGELKNDIDSLKPQQVHSKFTILETDDPCDLLLIGTEIRDSCQRVEGDPEKNKCLVSYMMNGEIKAIVVKAGGKIVARSLIRMMWDSVNNRRVILQEQAYNNIKGNRELEVKINEWAIKKAEDMGCPLVSAGVGQGHPYSGKVEFFGGFAPYTYSDAAKGVKFGYFETPDCETLFEPIIR